MRLRTAKLAFSSSVARRSACTSILSSPSPELRSAIRASVVPRVRGLVDRADPYMVGDAKTSSSTRAHRAPPPPTTLLQLLLLLLMLLMLLMLPPPLPPPLVTVLAVLAVHAVHAL